jgi:hypothetical protein
VNELTGAAGSGGVAFSSPSSFGNFATFAAIRRAYAIPNFFDTCARV